MAYTSLIVYLKGDWYYLGMPKECVTPFFTIWFHILPLWDKQKNQINWPDLTFVLFLCFLINISVTSGLSNTQTQTDHPLPVN